MILGCHLLSKKNPNSTSKILDVIWSPADALQGDVAALIEEYNTRNSVHVKTAPRSVIRIKPHR